MVEDSREMDHNPCSSVVVDKIHMNQLKKSTEQMHKHVLHCYNQMTGNGKKFSYFLSHCQTTFNSKNCPHFFSIISHSWKYCLGVWMSLYRYSGNTAGHWKLQFTYNYFRSKRIVRLIWANWASALLLVAEGYVYLRQKVGDWIQAFMSLQSEVNTGQRESVGQGSTRFIQDQVQLESWVIRVWGREME